MNEEKEQKPERAANEGRQGEPGVSQYLTLKVEVKPSTDIKYAAKEACELAKRLGITVEFKFNDVICIARPTTKYLELVGKWYLELSSDKSIKIATAG